ncbi:hypothetical protein [Escherichia coli]|uniref:hypothetical protein n=1 Tax=Escherichia coli TaxID=562 RepID=UPI00388DA319
MAATHTLPLASPGMARICLYGDLQRFGRRIDLRVKTGAEAIRALAHTAPGVSSETERRLVSGTDFRAGRQHVRIDGAVT